MHCPEIQTYVDAFRPTTVKIKINPEKLAQYQLNPITIQNTINNNYQSSPLGSLYVQNQQYLLGMNDNYNSLTALQNLVIGYRDAVSTTPGAASSVMVHTGVPIYLKDIADIAFESRSIAEQPYANFNGKAAVQMQLYTRTVANPLTVSKNSTRLSRVPLKILCPAIWQLVLVMMLL